MASKKSYLFSGKSKYNKIQHQWNNGEVFLTARAFAYSNKDIKPMYEGFRNRMRVTNWNKPDDYATADVVIKEAGTYNVFITYNESDKQNIGTEVLVEIAEQEFEHTTILCKENSEYIFEPQNLGQVSFDKPGKYTITIKAKEGGVWNDFGLQSFKLERIK